MRRKEPTTEECSCAAACMKGCEQMEDPYLWIDRIAVSAMEELRIAHPGPLASYTGRPDDPWLEDTRRQLAFLFDAVSIGSPELFISYIAWSKIIMKHSGAPTDLLLEKLKLMRKICQEKLEGPFAKKVDLNLEVTIRGFPQMPESTPSYISGDDALSRLASAYIEHLLAGERYEGEDLVRKALYEGVSFEDLYLNVFQRVQYDLGRRWEEGQISVAQEHYVTEATQQLMAQLFAELVPRRSRKGKVVVACVGNEMHEMGARMVSDFLEADGWNVTFLGSNTPHPDIVSITRQRHAKVLLVSVTMSYNIRRVMTLIRFVRSDPSLKDVKILVGGHPFNEAEGLWKAVGADGFARDAPGAVRLVNEMVGR